SMWPPTARFTLPASRATFSSGIRGGWIGAQPLMRKRTDLRGHRKKDATDHADIPPRRPLAGASRISASLHDRPRRLEIAVLRLLPAFVSPASRLFAWSKYKVNTDRRRYTQVAAAV